jgi:hypothetical protein
MLATHEASVNARNGLRIHRRGAEIAEAAENGPQNAFPLRSLRPLRLCGESV